MGTHATQKLHRKLALAFDFDDTLAPDTLSGVLRQRGVDPDRFFAERVTPRVDAGWDPVPAALFGLVEVGREGRPVTRDELAGYGRSHEPFEGVERTVAHLRRRAAELVEGLEFDHRATSTSCAAWSATPRRSGTCTGSRGASSRTGRVGAST